MEGKKELERKEKTKEFEKNEGTEKTKEGKK
jgi:hypothetical protein